jgi:ABC-2 type transport system ATP-binding protein
MRVKVQQLEKRHSDHFRLRVPHFEVAPGTTLGLVGNNGAGKTTFLRLLLDLLPPDAGTVLLDDHPVAQTTEWKPHTGSFLDESFLMDFLTTDEFFAFIGRLYGMDAPAIQAALRPYHDFFTDEPLGQTSRYLRDLSSGNRQKVGLIGAMLIQPKLLVLDEPFANLDPRSQFQLRALLRRINREHNTTLILSSHDLAHVTEVCERIALIEDGKIVRDERTRTSTLSALRQYFTRPARQPAPQRIN